MSNKKYVYNVQESTVDVRNYTIECNEELRDDIYRDIVDMISAVDIGKEGDWAEYITDEGVECVVTYIDTDFGDDAQITMDLYVDEDEGSYDSGQDAIYE